MIFTKLPSAVLIAFSLTTCLAGQDLRNTEAAKAACGAFDDKFSVDYPPTPAVAATPQPGKALVYLIQMQAANNSTCLGQHCGSTTKIGMDGSWLGATAGSSFFSVNIDPGQHHLCANWEAHTKLLSQLVALHGFQAEAGKTYYFGIAVSSDTNLGGSEGFSLIALNEDEGKMLVSAYPLVKSTKR